MVKAYACLGVSGRGQVSGDGFPRQLKAIQDHAASHEIRVMGVFREKGVSGVPRKTWIGLPGAN